MHGFILCQGIQILFSYFWRVYFFHRVLLDDVLLLCVGEDQAEDIVMVLDGFLRQWLAVRLAVIGAEPSEVVRNMNA